jgi:hypothetical protein
VQQQQQASGWFVLLLGTHPIAPSQVPQADSFEKSFEGSSMDIVYYR